MRHLPHSEADALYALQRGQECGLDYYFERYYTPLTLFAQGLVHDGQQAEEIAAEAYVKLWHKRENLQEIGSLKAWLYTLVRNACIDYLRKVKRLRVQEALKPRVDIVELPVLHHMVQNETISHLYQLLESLPLRCRQVFQMFYLQDKALKEIAEELNISINTVKSQKQRAVQLLKERIPFFLLVILIFNNMV
jgi:RNA polymerase sigma-70 factor (family 1)